MSGDADEPFTRLPAVSAPEKDQQIRRLMLFFGLVYVVEGIGQTGGLIAQPLNYYLKQTFGWTAVQVTAYLTILNLPWIIKPVYGIVSDFLPLFGYRRKSYLILANATATAAYCWVTQITAPSRLVFALLLTAYAMAISSTLCGAILVENGQRFGASDAFVNQQWLWFNIAALASGFVGGQLVGRLSPGTALHAAAGIIAVAPLAVGSPDELRALTPAVLTGSEGLTVVNDAMYWNNRATILALASAARIPAIYPEREYADDGGLITYGANVPDHFLQAAGYVDRILRGAKPGDLPINQSTKLDFVVNLRTARALGFALSPDFISAANEVIE